MFVYQCLILSGQAGGWSSFSPWTWCGCCSLFEPVSNYLVLGGTESTVMLVWVWCLSQAQTQEQETIFAALSL